MEIFDLKNTISKRKASEDALNRIMEGTEERNSEFRDKAIEVTQSEQQKINRLKKKKKEQSLTEMWDHNKRSNICVIRVPEGQEKEDKDERLSKK